MDVILIDSLTGERYSFKKLPVSDKKVALVIGHHANAGGATSPYLNNYNEWQFWNQAFIGEQIEGVTIFNHDHKIKSYTKRQEAMAERTKDFDLVLELHFNSAYSTSVNGCEALYYKGNKTTEDVSDFFCDQMATTMGYRNRGAKARTKGKPGYLFLYLQNPPAIILEPFCGKNKQDVDKFNFNTFKQVLNDTIEYFYTLK